MAAQEALVHEDHLVTLLARQGPRRGCGAGRGASMCPAGIGRAPPPGSQALVARDPVRRTARRATGRHRPGPAERMANVLSPTLTARTEQIRIRTVRRIKHGVDSACEHRVYSSSAEPSTHRFGLSVRSTRATPGQVGYGLRMPVVSPRGARCAFLTSDPVAMAVSWNASGRGVEAL
jgi:hypothetical protein